MTAPAQSSQCIGLRVKGLRKSYSGVPVLKGIDLDIAPGEIFVIMGPSGSGKSVLLRHLIGLEEPDEGAIFIDGEDIAGRNPHEQHRLGMVFQSGGLLNSLTVGENVGLFLTEHRLLPPEEIAEVVAAKLELVGLKGSEGRPVSELSGGMRKRVAIARALVMEPQIIFYDEPTSELDPLIATTIGEEIVHLNERTGATSLVVTHDRDLALGIADRMAVVFGGEILAVGTPDEVARSSESSVNRFLNANFNFKNNRPVTS